MKSKTWARNVKSLAADRTHPPRHPPFDGHRSCKSFAFSSQRRLRWSASRDGLDTPMTEAQQFEAFMRNYQNMVFSTAMRLLCDAAAVRGHFPGRLPQGIRAVCRIERQSHGGRMAQDRRRQHVP